MTLSLFIVILETKKLRLLLKYILTQVHCSLVALKKKLIKKEEAN